MENQGQIAWEGSKQDALDAAVNELTGYYGPQRFKITYFEEADEVHPDLAIELQSTVQNSKEIH